MYANLSDLEVRGEADDQDALLSALVRHAHSLKGGARTVALEHIERVCARLEATIRAVNAAAHLDGATVYGLRSVLSDVEELICNDTGSRHSVSRALRILEAIDPRTDMQEGNGAAGAPAEAVATAVAPAAGEMVSPVEPETAEPALAARAEAVVPSPEDVELAEAMAAAEATLPAEAESTEPPLPANAEVVLSADDVEPMEAVAVAEKPQPAEAVAIPAAPAPADAVTSAQAGSTESATPATPEIALLPEEEEPAAAVATATEAVPADTNQKKEEVDDPARDPSEVHILVVDDSATSRTFVKNVLEGAGYTVTPVSDGADALVVLAREQIDLVVSDVEMPCLDGLALTARVRGHPRLRTLPVILVSGLESEADRARGLQAGADDYIPRTELDELRLLETVLRLL
jgi:CheY-like chemotaxis protein